MVERRDRLALDLGDFAAQLLDDLVHDVVVEPVQPFQAAVEQQPRAQRVDPPRQAAAMLVDLRERRVGDLGVALPLHQAQAVLGLDRKSVVEGTRGSVRVDLGVRRSVKKQKTTTTKAY